MVCSRAKETLINKEIRQAASLTAAEDQRIFGWGDDIFGLDSRNLHWRPKDVHFLMYLDGDPVSHVGVLKHTVTVGGEPVTVGGVGAVVTVPEAQKRGCARALLQCGVTLFEEWRVSAGLLFCRQRLIPFYESQEWQVIEGPVLIQQPDGEINSPVQVMVRPFDGYTWPAGEVRLNSFPW